MPKKGAQKAVMTEEERLCLAKKNEEMLTLFLRDKLQKEERNSAVNMHKLNQHWRAILRQTRDAELQSDISVLRQTFERVIDRKDSVIQCLVRDLREAEQQSATVCCSHQDRLDRLLVLQMDRLAYLEQRWNSSLEEMGSEFDSERERVLTQHQQADAYLGAVTFNMEQCYTELEGLAQQEYQSTRDEIINRNSEEKKALECQQKAVRVGLKTQLKEAKEKHHETTGEFESQRAYIQRHDQEIATQKKKLHKMHVVISMLRAELTSSKTECDVEVEELRVAKEEVTLQTGHLKAQLIHTRKAERRRLINLTVYSDAAAKELQHIITKGERILHQGEMCRVLETEREKVLPFYVSSLTPEEQSQVKRNTMEPPSEELAKDYPDLDGFWQRYNKVLLERLCLEKERKVLAGKNRELQGLLGQYLDGISVSDDVLRQRNSLLMVSRPALAAASSATTERQRHNVVEAAHIVQHTL